MHRFNPAARRFLVKKHPPLLACLLLALYPSATGSQPHFSQTHPSSFRVLSTMAGALNKVPADSLFVSEPDPSWFGNGHNPKDDKNWTNGNWLKSRFHFAFAEYRDPKRSQFGILRVMNDDLVQPARGFGTHPHSNMEICTYIVNGSLSHQDSMGTKETLGPRGIQFMTAGTGVRHSEFNEDPTNPLRFIQMWMVPRAQFLPPNYGSMCGDKERQHNQWAHLVADVRNESADTPVKINQDGNIFVTELDAGKQVEYELKDDRQAYILCLEGSMELSSSSVSEQLVAHDACKAFGATKLIVQAGDQGVHVLMVEMKLSV
eukprot:m.157029 g.157029  ORF g.157029 m.157029 type:complete len:318 (-) comp16449_c0_seq11:2316-3269(-)